MNSHGRGPVLDGGKDPEHPHVGEGEPNGDGGEGQPEVHATRPFDLLHMPARGRVSKRRASSKALAYSTST